MAQGIDEKTVRKIAQLGRLKLADHEITTYAQQMDSILKIFNRLAEVPTENIEPLVNPVEVQGSLREDVLHEPLGAEELLKNAPDREGRLFKVPPVV